MSKFSRFHGMYVCWHFFRCAWLLLILLVVVSTFIHWLIKGNKEEKNEDKHSKLATFWVYENHTDQMQRIQNLFLRFLLKGCFYSPGKCLTISMSFSICNNTSRLMKNIRDDSEGLLAGQSVRGIYVASVAWIILGHTYLFPYEGYYFQMSMKLSYL